MVYNNCNTFKLFLLVFGPPIAFSSVDYMNFELVTASCVSSDKFNR
jgi:hypothetical protein